jgi:hypothetical protein
MQYNRSSNSVIRSPLSPWITESTLGSGWSFQLSSIDLFLFIKGTYGIVECVRNVNTRQRLARKTIKLTSKQEEENELPATAVREIAVVKSIQHENIIT